MLRIVISSHFVGNIEIMTAQLVHIDGDGSYIALTVVILDLEGSLQNTNGVKIDPFLI